MNRITAIALLLVFLFVGSFGFGPTPVVETAIVTAAPAWTASGQPMIELTKTCPKLRYLGREATFEITVANTGTGPAQDVVVTDVNPQGIEFVSADSEGTRQGGNIIWQLGALDAGKSRVLKTTFRCNRIGKYKNSATVTYCAAARDECELEVKGISAILLECVDDPDPIEINSNVTYTITVTNQGSAVGTNIAITCTLPKEQEHVSSTGPSEVRTKGKMVTFAPLPTLAPKAKAVYEVTVKGTAEGDVRFRVEMKSDQMTSPVSETESTHIY